MKQFDPFEKTNAFYEYEVNISDAAIKQLLILLQNNKDKGDQLTTFNLHNVLDFPVLNDLKAQVIDIIEEHDLVLGNNWSQLYNTHDNHPVHTHEGSKYSGIIYVSGKHASPTTFYSRFFNRYQHEFKKNTLLLFPGWIPHQVERLKKDEERLIISFNANEASSV